MGPISSATYFSSIPAVDFLAVFTAAVIISSTVYIEFFNLSLLAPNVFVVTIFEPEFKYSLWIL